MDTFYVTSNNSNENISQVGDKNPASDNYLSDNSKKDAEWDRWRSNTQSFQELLVMGNETDILRYSQRIAECSKSLLFSLTADSEGELHHRLKSAFFCRFRHCPVCQARRSRRNYIKFLNSLPQLLDANNGARWVFLTLTVPNVKISKLRGTLKLMTDAWQRLLKRKEFADVIGWVRSTEVTKEKKREGYAHPHFHVLMMVKSTYFKSDNYVNRLQWLAAWQGSMRDESIIGVDVRIADRYKGEKLVGQALMKSVSETLKYSTKVEDLLFDRDWSVGLIRQVHGLRFLASGGLLKKIFIDEPDDDELIHTGEDETSEMEEVVEWMYWWKPNVKRYARNRNIEN